MKALYLSILLYLICHSAVSAEEKKIKIYELKYTPATELVSVVKDFVDAEDVVTAKNFKLIVRSDEKNHRIIKTLLEQLDQKPAQIRVSFKQGSLASGSSQAKHYTTQNVERTILATSGSRFHVSEQNFHYSTNIALGNLWLGNAQQSVNAERGFEMTVTLLAQDEIRLEIFVVNEKMTKSKTGLKSKKFSTQLFGSLNRWILLASNQRSQAQTISPSTDALGVFVKVELLD